MQKILLVEDDAAIAKNLSYLLSSEGYQVTLAQTQRQALTLLEEAAFDLLIIDISLPDGSGYAVCGAARHSSDAAIIFLTAADDEASVVTGLDLGADDYISKPFRPLELLSRIRTVLRRHGKADGAVEIGQLRVDLLRGAVHKQGQEVFLSALEYRLLLALINNRGQVLSRGQLLAHIWDVDGDFVNDNTLTVYIKRLREMIEDDPQNPTIITTVRGLGYRLEEA